MSLSVDIFYCMYAVKYGTKNTGFFFCLFSQILTISSKTKQDLMNNMSNFSPYLCQQLLMLVLFVVFHIYVTYLYRTAVTWFI